MEPAARRFRQSAALQCAAALLLGLLGAAGFAPVSLAAALAASTAGLFWMVSAAGRVRTAAALGFFWGLAYFSAGLSWTYSSMHVYGGIAAPLAAAGVVLLAALLALVPAAACAAAAAVPAPRAVKLVLVLPAAWALGELVRGPWVMGFGWLSSGYAWGESLFKSWAPVAGVIGLGLVVHVLIGTLLVLLAPWDRRRVVLRAATACLAGALALTTAGLEHIVWARPAASLEVRLVQPDLPVAAAAMTAGAQRERTARVEAMSSRSALGGRIDLTVWPEGLYAAAMQRLPPELIAPALRTAQRTHGAVLVNGFSERAADSGARTVQNTLWLAEPAAEGGDGARLREVYQKHHLVPFGEFVPAGFRWFVDALGIPMADQTPGPAGGAGPVTIAGVESALSICYENMFGEELRLWWRHGNPQVIFNVANLGWFAPHAVGQFTQMSVMRALETARPFVQAVNNAGSALILPNGLIERSAAPGAQNLDLRVTTYAGEPTWFVRLGNAPAAAAALLLLAAGVLAGRLGRARRAGTKV